MDCLFCNIYENEKERVVLENDLAYAIFDGFPVSKGHMLIIPKRHCVTYFEVTAEEAAAMKELVTKCKEYLDEKYQPDGYNIGLNCGHYAGQTVMHTHMHIIPRYKGDIENPRGGVRNLIKYDPEF